MRLLHFALRAEAQAFIETLKAEPYPIHNLPSFAKLFRSKDTLLLIGGIGQEATAASLNALFDVVPSIRSAVNIGIAGCNDIAVPVGTLFSYMPYLPDNATPPLISCDAPVTKSNTQHTTLYDMECAAFYETVRHFVAPEHIGVYKIVSDHLNDTIPSKAFVKELMLQHHNPILKAIDA